VSIADYNGHQESNETLTPKIAMLDQDEERFDRFVIDEVKTLLSDLQNDCEPSNICLLEVVLKELMDQARHQL
jgi:hypothetical protein